MKKQITYTYDRPIQCNTIYTYSENKFRHIQSFIQHQTRSDTIKKDA